MKYFNYKNTFTVDSQRIRTDRGQIWELNWLTKGHGEYGLYTNWWRNQYPSELRTWQKEILKDFGNAIRDRSLALVYERGQGYNQAHDIAVGRFKNYMVMMTEQDCWVQYTRYDTTDFDRTHSMGSVLDKQVQTELFKICQALKKEYNMSKELAND